MITRTAHLTELLRQYNTGTFRGDLESDDAYAIGMELLKNARRDIDTLQAFFEAADGTPEAVPESNPTVAPPASSPTEAGPTTYLRMLVETVRESTLAADLTPDPEGNFLGFEETLEVCALAEAELAALEAPMLPADPISEVRDSRGTIIPPEVVARLQRTYGEASALVVTNLLTRNAGFGYAAMKDSAGEHPMLGIVICAIDPDSAGKLFALVKTLGAPSEGSVD